MKIQVEKNKDTPYVELLCVEEGSVDLDKLRENGVPDSKIIVYRKGSKAPYILRIKSDE